MNVTAIFAIAILLPQITRNQYLQFLIPISMMLVKDYLIGFHSLMFVTYSCTILFVLLGKYLNEIYATFIGVLLWHLIVNFAVWWSYGGNLLQTYILAIPFDFNLLVSTLICVILGKLCLGLYYRYYY
tara:strand:- start:242 stop:625 length:384 start_codon:yes stop_codon:yes gene_type:complete